MNKRFNEIARQQNNVNLDRSFFNANTRQDKNWDKQSNVKKHNNTNADFVNMDRQFFNVNTNANFEFADNNSQINNRQFNNFEVAHNLRNRQTTFHDNRLMTNNARQHKKILKNDDNTFVKRMVNTNPYAQPQIGVTRIQTIDTKHSDSNKYKQQAKPKTKNKFNPYAIY